MSSVVRVSLLAATIACAAAEISAVEVIAGRVVAVTDGDTIGVLVDGREVRIRLAEVDAPETGQPYGAREEGALRPSLWPRRPARGRN